MATVSGIVQANGLPRDNVEVSLYEASAFASPPEKGTEFPDTGLVATVTSGDEHGGDGAYRFTDIDAGSYYAGADWDGTVIWDSHVVGHEFELPYVNVGDFGAVGNGTADDTSAIQAAIDSLSSTGGAAVFPVGTFKITSGLTIPASNIKIIGQGHDATVISYTPTTGTALKSSDQSTARTGIELRGFTLSGAGGAATVGIDLKSLSDCLVTDIALNNFATNLNLDGSITCYYNTFLHCKFSATLGSGQVGINFATSANAQTFIGCRFSRLAKHVVIGSGASSTPNQVDFINCHWELAETTSIDLVKALGIRFLGGRWESNVAVLTFPGTNAVREIIWEPAYLNGNTALISGQQTALTVRNGGHNSLVSQGWGYSQSPAMNRLPNAMMEGWGGTTDLLGWSSLSTSNWDTTGFETRESTVVKSGSYALKAGDGSNNSRGVSCTARVPVRDDLAHTFSMWWTSPELTTGMRFGFRCFDSSGTVITTGTVVGTSLGGETTGGASDLTYSASFNAHILGSDQFPAVANTYERLGGVFHFPTGTVSVRFGVWVVGSGGTKYVYVDDVFLGEGPCPPKVVPRPLWDGGAETLHGDLTIEGAGVLDATPTASTSAALLRLMNAISGGNADGTALGMNAPTNYSGDLIWCQIGSSGTPAFCLRGDGAGGFQAGFGRVPANSFTVDISGSANNGSAGSARLRNQSTGTSAYAALEALSGSADGLFGAAHSGYTGAGLLANRIFIRTGGGSETGISLDANRAGQDIRFNVGTSNEQFRFAAGLLTLADGVNIAADTTTGTKIGTATGQKLGFFNATPIVQPTGATQTYSTADGTHANPTAATLTVADGAGTNDNTIGAITADASVIAAVQELADEINKLVADMADVKQFANFLCDTLQSLGLLA